MSRRAGINDDDEEPEWVPPPAGQPRPARRPRRRPQISPSSGPIGAQIHTTGGSRWEISLELLLNKETESGSGYFVKCVRYAQDDRALETLTHRFAPLSSIAVDPNAAANQALGRILSVLAACGDYQESGEIIDEGDEG